MDCTGCKHLAPAHGECQRLIPKAICGPCLEVHDIAGAKCPKCGAYLRVPASPLHRINGVFQRSPFCPLTIVERKRLDEKQTRPVEQKTQRELF
jgi:hypothetical protein